MKIKENHLFIDFLIDVAKKLRMRFAFLVMLSVACAMTDGLRIMTAFLLLPFFGIQLGGADGGLGKLAHTLFETFNVPFTFPYVALFVTIAFASQAFLFLTQSWFQATCTQYYSLLWRTELFRALTLARWRFFLSINRGELTNVLSQESARLSTAILRLLTFCSELLVAVSYISISFFISHKATFTMIGIGAAVILFNSIILRHLMRHAWKAVKSANRLMVLAQEFLSNIKAIKAAPHGFSLEMVVVKPLQSIFESERIGFMLPQSTRVGAEFFIMMTLMITLATFGSFDTATGGASQALMVILLFVRAYSKITTTLSSIQEVYARLPEFDHIRETCQQAQAEAEPNWSSGKTLDPKEIEHGIRLENVNVSHGTTKILKNIDMYFPPRGVTAVTGPSGAGKTTLVDTLLRLTEIESGRMSIGEYDANLFNTQSWRACFGYVSQELTLINGTIADNIRLFRPDATIEDVRQAAQKAYADDFIEAFPQGYETPVGEMGLKLSGGQRQRIAVARALINDPPILIFDEATSALDSESEEKIVETIAQLRESKCIIVVAHRLSTITHADNIFVLHQGQLVETGNVKELVEKHGVFYELWRRQAYNGNGSLVEQNNNNDKGKKA